MVEKIKNRAIGVLRWSERYTKTDMVYLVEGGFWLTIGQIVASGAALLTSIAFANLLPPETYGTYKYIISIASLVMITTLTGVDAAVTQSVARGFEGALSVGAKMKMKWGTIGTAIALVIGGYYFLQGNMVIAISFSVVSLFMPFSESFDIYNAFLAGKKLFATQTLYGIIRKIIYLIAIIGILFLTDNIYIILSVYFLSITLPALIFLFITTKKYKTNNAQDSNMISFGKHLSLVHLMSLVLMELDKILIFHYVGAVNLAVYALAVAPADQIKGVFKNINALAMPQFAQRTIDEIKSTIRKKLKILLLGVSITVVIYILLAPPFFKIFFPKYLASVPYSQILSLGVIPVVITGLLYTILEAKKAKRELYEYSIYSNVLNIIILFPLVYYFGIWGAVFSRIIARLFSLGLTAILVSKLR